jgi:predicted lysophospholipase L1 biosynthesis ABC-type transport system permease subunit
MDQNPLNDGAAVAVAAKDALATRLEFATLYARFAPGADRAALVERLTEQLGPTNVRTVGRTVTALNLQRVQDLPPQLADLLLLLALATVAHSVVTSVRERRRDIAMLKTLGFVRRQALSVVTAQATTFMTVALVLGIPLGYALGKWSWIALASRIGIVPAPATDAVALALYAAGVLVAANLVAVFPGRAAARSRVSVVLRTE